jgi:glycogen debranching enzyme
MSEELFSEWGVRTLATDAQRYNPMSYHNGSVWPHDVALIAEGLALVDRPKDSIKLMTGLFNASLFMEHQRLPELFCGFPKRVGEGPTSYPVACSPQAWSVASVLMMLKACLRIDIDAQSKKVRFKKPILPAYLDRIAIEEISIGESFISIEVIRYQNDVGINVMNKPSDWEILIVK